MDESRLFPEGFAASPASSLEAREQRIAKEFSLAELRDRARVYELHFCTICERHYPSRWDFYRADDAGIDTPAEVRQAHEAWIRALHAYYLARDGAKGFLGGRGQ